MSDEQHHRLALPQGTRIRDFEFHRVLGHGGFGITYLGWNVTLDIPVAIKEYLPADLATREQDLSVVPQTSQAASDFQWGLERFLDEARTLARFQHPNIVRVHHFFEAHSTAYIAMDYVEGEDLSAYLRRKGTLNEDELKGILYSLLDALEVVHQADFLHRDIKPGNIVLRDSDGSPVLLDFGAARQAIGAKSRSVTSIVTPGYAPIEQYSSRGRQGAWTDIYALGGVCYRALTGQVPEDATDRVRNDPLIPVAQRCAGRASRAFLSAIDLALSVDEGDRPQSVGAWRSALEADAGEERRGTRETLDVWRKEQVAAPSEPVVCGETGDAVPSDTKEKGEGGSKPARAKWFAVVLCVVTLLIMVAIATQEQAALERQRREQAALEKQRQEQAALEKQRQEEALYSDRKREPSAAPASGPRLATYVVKRGDYLAQIARLHQMSVAEIIRINKLKKNAVIVVGDRLKVRPPMHYYEEQALEQQRQEQAALEQQRQERAALGEEEEIVELWRVEKKPVITKKVKPKYPTTAQKANITGKVFVTALIGKDGKVEQIGKITGPKVFHEVAKAAALQSEFTPAMQNDRPVKVWVSLPFTFRLK
ncbi:MAG: TonB family protein [Gemmatimonadetes bacterium]|nr:TonB family protein [Gemmatimonadota bacterium]